MEEDIEQGGGRVDWNRVRNTVALHAEAERNAHRRRGQQTFNQLIKKGVPYTQALREAADAGMFYDNEEAAARALREAALMENKEPPKRDVRISPQYGVLDIPTNGAPTVLIPPVDKPKPPQRMPIVATKQDPITGASMRLNADQLHQDQIKSTLQKRSEMEPESHFIGQPTYNAEALGKNTAQLKALRLEGEKTRMAQPAITSEPLPLPRSKDDLKKGEKYITRKGVATWDGDSFVR